MQLLSIDQPPISNNNSNISINNIEPLHNLASDYLNLISNGSAFSDVVFSIEGKQLHAHRCILAARSSFFRMVFGGEGSAQDSLTNANNASNYALPLQIPVEIVGYNVFVIIIKFLYSGQLIFKCSESKGCWHSSQCSSSVDLALEALHAANLFGVEQLSTLIQNHLGSLAQKVPVEDVMKILTVAKKQGHRHLWDTCSELVAKSGIKSSTLRKHLPMEVATEIEEMRMVLQSSRASRLSMASDMSAGESALSGITNNDMDSSNEDAIKRSSEGIIISEKRLRRMKQALECMDVELVRLMVMEEGLDLDAAEALHYAVTNCSREVVKALLEMGVVNINHQASGQGGRTALHLASEMGNPDMISLLLDHQASPLVRSDNGKSSLDIARAIVASPAAYGLDASSMEENKLRLCLELLQSAAYVEDNREAGGDDVDCGFDVDEDEYYDDDGEAVEDDQLDEDLISTSMVSDGAMTEPSTSHTSTHILESHHVKSDLRATTPQKPNVVELNPDWASCIDSSGDQDLSCTPTQQSIGSDLNSIQLELNPLTLEAHASTKGEQINVGQLSSQSTPQVWLHSLQLAGLISPQIDLHASEWPSTIDHQHSNYSSNTSFQHNYNHHHQQQTSHYFNSQLANNNGGVINTNMMLNNFMNGFLYPDFHIGSNPNYS